MQVMVKGDQTVQCVPKQVRELESRGWRKIEDVAKDAAAAQAQSVPGQQAEQPAQEAGPTADQQTGDSEATDAASDGDGEPEGGDDAEASSEAEASDEASEAPAE